MTFKLIGTKNFVNVFDQTILKFLNQFSQESRAFDSVLVTLAGTSLLKGVILVSILLYLWFYPQNKENGKRVFIFITFVSAVISFFVGKVLSILLPLRQRPLFIEELEFTLPYAAKKLKAFEYWTSMPSDHAVLFFSLVTGIFFVSCKAGYLSAAYAFFVICLPRIYIGFHYPTDILVGMMIGIIVTVILLKLNPIQNIVRSRVLAFERKSPEVFYALGFFFVYQVATMLWDVRLYARLFSSIF